MDRLWPELPGTENSAWLAALGAIADVGSAAPFASLIGFQARGAAWAKAISLGVRIRQRPPNATGGSLSIDDFGRLMEVLQMRRARHAAK
jgi:hypothetical protein